MATSRRPLPLLLLILFSFLLTVHATTHLNPSDHRAITTVITNFKFNSQLNSSSLPPCNIPGVFCERRTSTAIGNTYELRLTRLVFKSRSISGTLSPAIGRLPELKQLSLPNNSIVDQIPSEIANCKKLEILDLANNQLSGNVPNGMSALSRLRFLDLSFNSFSGDLSFLNHFPNLETLSLANNFFTGHVPKSIRSFRNLQFSDFSGNRFLEEDVPAIRIPESESQYPKRYILTENETIPHRKNVSSVASAPSSMASGAQAPGPSSQPRSAKKGRKKGKKKLAGWLLGFAAGTTAGTITGFLFSVLFRMILAAVRGAGKQSGPAIFSPMIKNSADLAFLEKEDGLASLEIIGRGGCGEVYKAELPGSNGKMIAIKKVIQPTKEVAELTDEDSKLLNKKMRQIRSEINTVGQIRHRNLLPLLAHVIRPDCHYLVYEFMKNGSLQDLLEDVSREKRELEWPARYNIALGIASGLEYLHINHNPRIIHRDLKPANILLDDDMEARIADFGLAKSMPDANTHITSSNIAGTVGYIAPEYYQTFKFTDKCDIYSFGVVLGVLLIGKLPSDEFFQHIREMSLVKWLKNIMTSEEPTKAIDEKLMGKGYEEQMLLVLKIACFCTMEDPKQRPNSKDVRAMLAQIKH
ncbi:Leucine-rich repeat receptor-like serine/threonine/tyrosine-protein kinase SOBIR1 [Linum perenne]